VSNGPEPLVSVVLRTYDHAPFIAQAIESVLIQRAPFPFELVIGEDCSRDGTREIVRGYAERRPEVVRAVLPERNVGHGQILRQAMEATRGRFIAYLDGDDYWTSAAKLRRQVEFLEADPGCPSCFHDVSLVYDTAGVPSGSVSPGLAESRFSLADIVAECFVPAPAMLFRREIATALPDWSYDSAWIDWLIHIRAAERGSLGYIAEPLAAYRVHDGGMFSGLDRVDQLEEDLRFYDRLLPELPDQKELIGRCMQYRRAQLAVERLGVPFDVCMVLVDPRRELRPYFNGRHARNLPRRDGREVTELETIRRAAAELAPAVRDYGQGEEPDGEDSGCYVVVPASAAEWLERHRSLRDYLEEHGSLAWEDASTAVHELPPLDGGEGSQRAARKVAIEPAERLPAGIAGANLEAPAPGAVLPAHSISLGGWILGDEEPVVAIELAHDGEQLWRAPVNRPRPDIELGFPERTVGTPGFGTTFNGCELPSGAAVDVLAILANGERLQFARLRLEGGTGG
jgi:glycosyltransferase involved in cell wall biosynthesis